MINDSEYRSCVIYKLFIVEDNNDGSNDEDVFFLLSDSMKKKIKHSVRASHGHISMVGEKTMMKSRSL